MLLSKLGTRRHFLFYYLLFVIVSLLVFKSGCCSCRLFSPLSRQSLVPFTKTFSWFHPLSSTKQIPTASSISTSSKFSYFFGNFNKGFTISEESTYERKSKMKRTFHTTANSINGIKNKTGSFSKMAMSFVHPLQSSSSIEYTSFGSGKRPSTNDLNSTKRNRLQQGQVSSLSIFVTAASTTTNKSTGLKSKTLPLSRQSKLKKKIA